MNRTSMDCHQIEDVPGLYIDAFSSEFLRKLKDDDETTLKCCCDTTVDDSSDDVASASAVDEASSCCRNENKNNNNNNNNSSSSSSSIGKKGRKEEGRRQHRCCCCLILTHYHSDHYQNLPRGRGRGTRGGGGGDRDDDDNNNSYGGPKIPIHCTPVTATLLVNVHGVPSHLVIAHEYGQRWSYKYRKKHKSTVGETNYDDGDDEKEQDEDDEEVYITFYDANHCPGAAIVVVEMPPSSSSSSSSSDEKEEGWNTNQKKKKNRKRKRKIHIHTGDMRYHPRMKSYPLLMKRNTNGSCDGKFKGSGGMDDIITEIDVDVLYLDTTYGRPKHTFQTQKDAINKIASQVERCLSLPTTTTLPLPLPGGGNSSSPSSSGQEGQGQGQKHQDDEQHQQNQKKDHHDDHCTQKKMKMEEGQENNNRHDDKTMKSEVTEDQHRCFKRQQQEHQHQQNSKRENNNKTLVLLSCYSIGKEKVLWECSKRTNELVYVSERKLRMMECIMTQTPPQQQQQQQQRKTTSSTGDGTQHSATREASSDTSTSLSPSSPPSRITTTTTDDANYALEDDEDEDILPCHRLVERCTRDPHKTPIHVVPMGLAGEMWPYFQPNYRNCVDYYEDMIDSGTTTATTPATIASPESETVGISQQQTMEYDRIVAFIPTGWADGSNWNKKNAVSSRRVQCRKDPNKYIDVEIRLISYSEHSSMTELEEFVRYLRPRKIIPTVFKDENDRRRLENLFSKYVDTSRAKLHFFKGMVSLSSSSTSKIGSTDTGMIERAAAKTEGGDRAFSRGLTTSTQEIRKKTVNNHTTSSSSTVKESLINENIEKCGQTIVDLTGSSDEEDQCVEVSKPSDGDRLSFSISEDKSFSSPTRPMKDCDKTKSSRQHCTFLTSTKLETRPINSTTAKPNQKVSSSGKGKRTLITQFFSSKKKTNNEGHN